MIKLFQPLPQIEALAAGRDSALDAVRAWSLAVVVFGHFLMQIVYWAPDDILISSNTLSSGRAWPFVTWILQVMPLFFLAGGAVNRASLQRFEGSYSEWIWKRVQRLLRPTMFLILTLALIFSLLTLTSDVGYLETLCIGIVGPLWFLGIYIPVISLTKFTVAWHERFGLKFVVLLVVLVVVVDALRFSVLPQIGALNALFAWVLAHQLGYFYDDGVNKRIVGAIAVTAIGINLTMTQVLHWYPISMVGLPTDAISNINPPTIAFVDHIVALSCLFMFAADRIRTALTRPALFRLTSRLGLLAMSLFLWHMPVLVIWYWLMHRLARDLPTVWLGDELVVPAGSDYWLWMIPWTAMYGLTVYGLLRIVWPLEYIRLPWFDQPASRGWRPRVWLGVTCLALGLLSLAGASLVGFPFGLRTLYGLPINNGLAVLSVIFGLIATRQAAQVAAE